ncbi:MAG: ATP-binding protein [Pseudomonadota bacterium]
MVDNILINRHNPWWQRPEAINDEPRLVALKTLPLVWHPSICSELNLEEDAVHVVTGPRQVGKSTTIRLMIRELLLEKKIPARNLLLFDCDIVNDSHELADIILHFFENISGHGRKFIFLDEVSFVEKWPAGIKWLIDQGKGTNCTYILTGSSSINLKKSGELMPARRGAGKDVEVHPLSFRQYVKLLGHSLPSFNIADMNFAAIEKMHSQLLLDIPNITTLFRNYCIHGGFLKPMNELHQADFISADTVDVYLSWLKGEVVKDKRREEIARIVLDKIISSLGSGISYQSLAEHMDVGSHNTARSYLDFFIDSFVLHEVPFMQISQRRIAWRKNRKYYFADPFLCWISMLWSGGGDNIGAVFNEFDADPSKMGPVIENIIENHLKFHGLAPAYGTARDREIDFAFPQAGIGIEVKYQNKIVPSDAAALGGFKHAVVVSRNSLADLGQAIAMPAYLFCLML